MIFPLSSQDLKLRSNVCDRLPSSRLLSLILPCIYRLSKIISSSKLSNIIYCFRHKFVVIPFVTSLETSFEHAPTFGNSMKRQYGLILHLLDRKSLAKNGQILSSFSSQLERRRSQFSSTLLCHPRNMANFCHQIWRRE